MFVTTNNVRRRSQHVRHPRSPQPRPSATAPSPPLADPRSSSSSSSAWTCSTARSSTSPRRRSAPTSARASSALQWIAGGYALTFAVGLVTGGRLGDIFGRRRLFLVGVAGFTRHLRCCAGWRPSPEMLIASGCPGPVRGADDPAGLRDHPRGVPARRAAKAFGAVRPGDRAGSAVLGPIVGGAARRRRLLGAGWRMIFLVNVPLGVARAASAGAAPAAGVARRRARRRSTSPARRSSSLAAGLLIYPLIQGREAGWPAWTFVSMAASAARRWPAFVGAASGGASGRASSPLVTPSLFRKRAFSAGLGDRARVLRGHDRADAHVHALPAAGRRATARSSRAWRWSRGRSARRSARASAPGCSGRASAARRCTAAPR